MSIAGIRSPAHNGASGMLHNYASDLVMLSRRVTERVTHIDERNRTGLLTEAMQNVDLASIKQEIELALEITDDISLPSTRAQLQRIHDLITHENPRGINPLYDWIRELANRLQDDAANINFIFLRSEVLRYYTDVYLFGEQVADRFPSAATDIAAAGQCLAVGQGTATVFHLVRALEIGLRVLAASLGISYAPSWESYLRQINANLTADHKIKSDDWKREEPLYPDIAGDLQIVKIAWRNPTMHVDTKYTPAEAEEIFRAVRTFMMRLATRFSEVAI